MSKVYSEVVGVGPSTEQQSLHGIYSCKIFVGGLPHDIDITSIEDTFRPYGIVEVKWPHMNESRFACPPQGFCFLRFQTEDAVSKLLKDCVLDGTSFYHKLSSASYKNKLVQIRPWLISDGESFINKTNCDLSNAIFVGGLPRTIKARELALRLSDLFGEVVHVKINVDKILQYPMGSARVFFRYKSSCILAISARFVQIEKKRLEVKPLIQQCKPCDVGLCQMKPATTFCKNISCLAHMCQSCWISVHREAGQGLHKPVLLRPKVRQERAKNHPQSWH